MTPMETIELKEYFEKQCGAHRAAAEVKFEAIEHAITLAAEGLNARLATMNEFREAMKDREKLYITRPEYDDKHETLTERIRELELSRAEIAGKASQKSVSIVLFIATIGLFLSAIQIILDFIKH